MWGAIAVLAGWVLFHFLILFFYVRRTPLRGRIAHGFYAATLSLRGAPLLRLPASGTTNAPQRHLTSERPAGPPRAVPPATRPLLPSQRKAA